MKRKKVYIELIRIIAMLFVLYVHTGYFAMSHYEVAGSRGSGLLAFFLMCVAITCNELFFMIAGVVLLHKKETIRRVLWRFFKMAVVVVLFSLFQYACNYWHMPAMGFRLHEFFKLIYQTNIITQYWFLYAYLAFILILPFLRMLAEKMDKEHFIYLMILYLLLEGVFPMIEYFWENEAFGLMVPVVENIIFFPLVGYFIEYQEDDVFRKKKILAMVNGLAVAALIMNMLYAVRTFQDTGWAETLDGMTMLVGLAIFVDIRYVFGRGRMPRLFEKVVVWCGGGMFGVCLLEPQLREGFFFLYQGLEPYIKWLPATVIWILAAMVTGIVVMHILKKIPVLKKLF